jgi:prepilin-type N-terminal cleavage/methylation domain-containing protein/prepilin-type processing-associated H-X9-DG protein
MHKRVGFTLIEILVVISIIAILIAILMPSLNVAKEKARAVICQNYLHQWGVFFNILASENEGKLVDRESKDFTGESCRTQQFSYYIDTFHYPTFCPSAKKKVVTTVTSGSFGFGGSSGVGSTTMAWYCPRHPTRTGSYGLNGYSPAYNQFGMRNMFMGFSPDNQSQNAASQGWKNVNQKNAKNIPLMLDCALWAGFPKATDAPPATKDQTASNAWVSTGSNGMVSFTINRHSGGINSLFMDSSVRKVGLKELYTLKWGPDFNTQGQWTVTGGVKSTSWPTWLRNFRDY